MTRLVKRNNSWPSTISPFGSLSSIFDDFWGANSLFPELTSSLMPLDVYEEDGQQVIKVDIPGANKEDIDVEFKDGGVKISYEEKSEKETNDKNYYRKERSYSSRSRFVPLPDGVDFDAIKGEYKDGVLTITAPHPQLEAPKDTKILIE